MSNEGYYLCLILAPDMIEVNFSISSNLMHLNGEIYVGGSVEFSQLSEVNEYVDTVENAISEIRFKWDTFNDSEIWNANQSYKWRFVVEYGDYFDIEISENKQSNLTILQEFAELTLNDSDKTMMYSAKLYTCSIICRSSTDKKCILFDYTCKTFYVNSLLSVLFIFYLFYEEEERD